MAVAFPIALTIFATLTIRFLAKARKRSSSLPLPPSPKGLPLLGHILEVPKEYEWKKYSQWSKQLDTDVISLNMMGSTVIVLDSLTAAEDLLAKRSSLYSSRPSIVMLRDLYASPSLPLLALANSSINVRMKCDWLLTVLPYDDRWKVRRKMLQSEFNHVETMRYQPHESRYARELLQRLLDTPDQFMEHIKYVTGAKILSISYGIDAKPTNDPNISLVDEAVDVINRAAIPGEYLVELLPFLLWVPDWMPGAGWKRMAKKWKKITDEMLEKTYMRAKESTAQGEAKPSFMSYCLEKMDLAENTEEQEQVIKETTATLYAGGADTTVSGLYTFFLAMLLYPETQARAQAELDEVLDRSRLPDFGNDEYELPYIKAIVLEVLRWMPVTPLGVPHLVTQEDEYKGYRIPAGSIVFANTWSILHDAAVFSDPEAFKPERWLNKETDANGNVKWTIDEGQFKDPDAVFGFGRRICPGRHLAVSSLWIAASTILSVFNITKEVGHDGKEVEPRMEYNSALICHPKQFKCSIKPRFPEAEDLIRASIHEY
ncbi:hypothetical protein PLEOSDRAFT_1079619 [Pleurotus ostreatus PC15]|uniref:Cytochrome P450 n=1 Tax=Pleurotus ostreatus (strain PC15) TaxID=1137138 RepID=A0A067NE86_PLEO1|nr:hypothetical protein PLEOSDRAFT_1079619 [Pleurotus ostreatus PC15]